MTSQSSLEHPWVKQRRQGTSCAHIARSAGVSHQWVSRVTAPFGPYPRPSAPPIDVVTTWVDARQHGTTITALSRSTGASHHTIREATREFGPFPRRNTPAGYLGLTDVADLLGLPNPTVSKWRTQGFLPDPIAAAGVRPLWTSKQILEWAQDQALPTCPACGARPRDLTRHHGATHRGRRG